MGDCRRDSASYRKIATLFNSQHANRGMTLTNLFCHEHMVIKDLPKILGHSLCMQYSDITVDKNNLPRAYGCQRFEGDFRPFLLNAIFGKNEPLIPCRIRPGASVCVPRCPVRYVILPGSSLNTKP